MNNKPDPVDPVDEIAKRIADALYDNGVIYLQERERIAGITARILREAQPTSELNKLRHAICNALATEGSKVIGNDAGIVWCPVNSDCNGTKAHDPDCWIGECEALIAFDDCLESLRSTPDLPRPGDQAEQPKCEACNGEGRIQCVEAGSNWHLGYAPCPYCPDPQPKPSSSLDERLRGAIEKAAFFLHERGIEYDECPTPREIIDVVLAAIAPLVQELEQNYERSRED